MILETVEKPTCFLHISLRVERIKRGFIRMSTFAEDGSEESDNEDVGEREWKLQ